MVKTGPDGHEIPADQRSGNWGGANQRRVIPDQARVAAAQSWQSQPFVSGFDVEKPRNQLQG